VRKQGWALPRPAKGPLFQAWGPLETHLSRKAGPGALPLAEFEAEPQPCFLPLDPERHGHHGAAPNRGSPAAIARAECIMAKSNTIQIRLVSTADTGYFYVTKKNARAQTGKMELRKYDPVVRKHVAFKEAKIK